MADARIKLAPFVQTRQPFTAVVGKMTHHHNHHGASEPVLLLTDVHHQSTGEQVADHIWVPFTAQMAAAVGHELFTNDQLAFTAKITTYRIHRDNITEQQHQVATANHDRRQRASAAFRAQYHDWEVLRQTLLDTNALVDQAVTAGTLSDEQAKTIKAENQRTYQDQEPHRELAPRLAIPQHRDYQLVELQAFRVTKSRRPHRGWQRTAYDPKRWSDRRYTRFLAARSMAYQRGVYFDAF
ncbi:hypothetical protein [Secundilactobacillus kimchicus]|uniref:Uncharacterized protein n=1 Tax=Secundilactobacillus kimchicus JCM 15530 TaxID=1302272 RepID=A0A0R1HN95_9LACO|nr:hypothetical protein [Secundilactobacillus kimchicus]KRK47903.1 hypothetical protein FC96_GL002108 [Secundilactobacillus kimchicus JCM 15530]